MGLTRARIRLANARRPDLAALEVHAFADTGALHLCIPKHIALQLQLDELEKREITIPDGSVRLVPYMGPVIVSFANRQCYVGAMVLGDEALLGAIPMEDMDLVVLPCAQQVAVNPANPNVAMSIAKGSWRPT
ncbi:MAG: clan AA aspartic protease [Alphaproteobacteria bacterium]|nr:MAG: clan AA aspartic protease [Alphaproteobacteria bacterium]